MKPWQMGLGGLFVVLGAIVGDLLSLSNPIIRNGWWTYLALAPGVALALVAIVRNRSWGTVVPALFSVLFTLGYTATRFMSTPSTPPTVVTNTTFPDFVLPDQNGANVSLADLRKEGAVVVVLFRGHW